VVICQLKQQARIVPSREPSLPEKNSGIHNAKGNGTEFKGPGPEEGIGKEKSKRLCVWGDA